MNYKQLTFNDCDFDNEFITFINTYQNLYQNEILDNSPFQVADKKKYKILTKLSFKDSLENFFFEPKYNNVLDILKLTKA